MMKQIYYPINICTVSSGQFSPLHPFMFYNRLLTHVWKNYQTLLSTLYFSIPKLTEEEEKKDVVFNANKQNYKDGRKKKRHIKLTKFLEIWRFPLNKPDEFYFLTLNYFPNSSLNS